MSALRNAILRASSGIFGVLLTFSGLAAATAQTPPAGTVTADLRYEEANNSVYDWSSFERRTEPFKVEPKELSSKVIRGTILFQSPKGALKVPFLWDQGNGKLYIDSNRNGDLTDDRSFTTVSPHGSTYQIFDNVHLSLRDGNDLYEQALMVNVYNYSKVSTGVTLSSKSCWLGRVTLQGADWQVGILEGAGGPGFKSGNGHLLLRPWSDHTKPFSANDDALSCITAPSQNIFFGNQAYHVDCRYVPGTPPKYQIEFTPKNVKLGELQISGKFINRLTLNQNTGDRYCVVLDKPEGKMQVPVGTYQENRVSLVGNIQAVERGYSANPNSINIAEGKAAVLNAGGPLTNTVSIGRRGDILVFSYSLTGAGGKTYVLPTMDRSKPPGWVVYRGNKEIASGKFEFG